MTTSCPDCAGVVAEGSRFCPMCGHAQPAPGVALLSPRFTSPLAYTPRHLAQRILTTRSALEGEHKRVTVLFCDIIGSMLLADRLGREEMHDLLQRFFDVALEEIHRYEGTINQFLGDGFMALFGAPLALEHHERQALQAAVAIREHVRAELGGLSELAGTSFAVRMGVNTGLVVVGKIGDNLRMDYTAIGDTTNVAARLESLAASGEILISETTWERVRDLVEARPRGPLLLKGKAEPVTVHAVTSMRRATAAPHLGRRLTPFVGRARELGDLLETLEHAEASQGQAVGIVAEPGMGKSRLLLEFRLTLRERRVTCLEGACVSYGSTIPYLPVLDLLRAAFGVVDTDTPEVMTERAAGTIAQLGMDAPSAVPYLLHLLGLKEGGGPLATLSPEAIRSRTSEVLRQLLVRASRRRPLVIIIEDIHWIDHASEHFLERIADVVPAASIMFVTTYRPGYSPPWLQRSYAMQIALRPLAGRDATELVRHVAGAQISDAGARALVERGEGNPLFLEELVQATGRSGGPAAARIPETLLGVLTARIDRLSDDAKELLQMASVVGRDFSPTLLAELVTERAGLDTRLQQLTQQEFLNQLTPEPEPVYAFRHALTRDAVYHSLLERRRRVAHGAVGRTLERLHAGRLGEYVELLAHHFELSDEGERAVDYAIRAAERAQRRWANAEALGFFERALAGLTKLPDTAANRLRRIDAITKQAELLFALGRHRDHVATLESIRDLVETAADPPRRAAWHFWLGFLQSLTGARPEVAIAHCQVASELADVAGLHIVRAHADTGLAQAYVIAGDFRRAIDAGERALAVFESHGDAWWASRALSQLSPAANHLGEWERGLGYCRRAMELGIALDDLRLKVSGLVRTASTHAHRGDWQPAAQLCEQALALDPTPFDAAAVLAVRGYARIKAEQIASGVDDLKEAIAFYERSQLRYTRSLFALWLADGYVRQGNDAQASTLASEVLGTARELGYRHLEGIARRVLGQAVSRVDAALAREHLAAAEALLAELDVRNELGKVWVARACLNLDSLDRLLLQRALRLFQALGTIDEPTRVEQILRTGHF